MPRRCVCMFTIFSQRRKEGKALQLYNIVCLHSMLNVHTQKRRQNIYLFSQIERKKKIREKSEFFLKIIFALFLLKFVFSNQLVSAICIKLCLIGCSPFCATLVCTIIFDVIYSFYARLGSFSIRSLFLNTLTFQSGS